MRFRTNLLLIAFSSILLFSCFANAADDYEVEWSKEQRRWVATIKVQTNIGEGGGIIIDDIVGNLEFHGGSYSKAEVEVKFYAQRGLSESRAKRFFNSVKPEIEERGTEIFIRGNDRRRSRTYNNTYFEVIAKTPEKFNIDGSTSGGNISADNVTGDLEFSTSGGNLVFINVHERLSGSTSGGNVDIENSSGEIDLSTSGGNITLEDVDGIVEVSTSGGNIGVRSLKGHIDGSTSGGNIVIKKTEVDRMEMATSGGNISCYGLKVEEHGDFATSGGNIEFTESSGTMSLGTSGGVIRMEDHTGDLDLSNSAGNIIVKGLNGSIEASISSGDIRVGLVEGSSAENVELETGHGDISLYLPKKFGADIRARVSNSYDDDAIYSDFPLKIRRGKNTGICRASGSINSGGANIIVESGHGEIRIIKR